MNTQLRKYTFHTDPGHGWLEVPLSDIIRLGIEKEITSYSYFKRDSYTVFLEEDCDAPLFINKAKELGWELEIRDDHRDYDHWIRNLNSFPGKIK